MQLTFITIGTLKEGYLREALAEYEKRISAFATVRNVNLPEVRITDEENPQKVQEALEAEGDKILAAIPDGAYVVALCVEGKQYASEELARLLGDARDSRGKVAFIIGSSHGLAPKVKSAAHLRLSVSRLTFPHQLMRVLLAETTYRSLTILAGKRYHK